LPGALLLMVSVLECSAACMPQLHGSSCCVVLLVHRLKQRELTSILPSQTSVAANEASWSCTELAGGFVHSLPVLLQGVIWPPLLGRCAKPFLDLLLNHLRQLICRNRLLARDTCWLGLGCCCLAKGLLACTTGRSKASFNL
jgi:hypothetical protein